MQVERYVDIYGAGDDIGVECYYFHQYLTFLLLLLKKRKKKKKKKLFQFSLFIFYFFIFWFCFHITVLKFDTTTTGV